MLNHRSPSATPGLYVPTFGARIAMAAGIGLLFACAFPPVALPILLPFAVAGLLLLLDGMTVRQAAYIGLTAGFVFFAVTLRWLSGMFGAAAVSLWVISALFPMLFCALMVWLRRRLPFVPTALLAGIVWTGTEYFRSERMLPSFGWMGLGYALADDPWLVGLAAWVGSYGVTFAIVLLGAWMACLATAGIPGGGRARRVVVLAACWALLLLATMWLSHRAPAQSVAERGEPKAGWIHVRLVQASSEDDESLFGMTDPKSQRASAFRPDVIVWPEYSYVSDVTGNRKLWSKLAHVAQDHRCWFMFGAKDVIDRNDDKAFRNTVYLLSPQGLVIGRHVKNHTVPFINDGVPGTHADAFVTSIGVLGVGTCFDMDYPDVARRSVDAGAECLLVPSDNPAEWGPLQHAQHRRIFQMRAVECGRMLATADVAGSTFASAPDGRVVQSVDTIDPAFLDTRIALLQNRTLFVRGGWRFGPACLLLLVGLFAWSLLPERRARSTVR